MRTSLRRAPVRRVLIAASSAAGLTLSCAGGGARYDDLEARWRAAAAPAPARAGEALFAGADLLGREALVAEVLRRNPTLASAREAWRAALARYPQRKALEDPAIAVGIAPASYASRSVRDAYSVELSQALPFPGKLALRGDAALSEAEATAGDHASVRLRLAAMASALYDEYWLAARSVEITQRHLELVRELHVAALASYASGAGSQQDPLRAELEEAELLHQQVEQETSGRVAANQLAALLHGVDGARLPPPPVALPPLDAPELDDADALERAISGRPELQAADARVRAREADVGLARREFFPDFKLVGAYDAMWDVDEMRPFVGLEMNVPIQLGRRRAALEQASAELRQARRERERLADEIGAEARSAQERLHEAHHLLGITRDRMLPAAKDRLAAARAGYEAGTADFRDLVEAERALRSAELEDQRAQAELSRRAADLLAAIGVAPGVDAVGRKP